MNVLLLTNDIDGVGVDFDVKFMKKNLVDICNVVVIHFGKSHNPSDALYSLRGMNYYNMYKEFKVIMEKESINIAHVRGIISKSHILWFSLLITNKVPYLISPFSQLNSYNLNNKLFFENPDIKTIQQGVKNKVTNKQYFLNKLIPLLKKVYLYSVGRFFIMKSRGLICFSTFEKEYAANYKTKIFIIKEPNLIDDSFTKESTDTSNVYSKNAINIVYWGRLDYYLKGLDRLIDMSVLIKNEFNDSSITIHLMGPDYNNGLEKIKNIIFEEGLSNIIIIHPENVWKGTKSPLIEADYSILLSRWDGYPRSLRESIGFGVPVIVSEETNFYDLVIESGCGYRLDGDINRTRNILKSITKLNNRELIFEGCISAQNLLSKNVVLNNLVEVYRESYESA